MGGVDSKFKAPPGGGGDRRGSFYEPVFKHQEEHPGTYDNLSRKCKDLFPEQFDGFKVKLTKSFSKDLKEAVTLTLFSSDDYNTRNWSLNPQTTFCHRWSSSWSDFGGDSSSKTRHKVILHVVNHQLSTTYIGVDFRGEGFTGSAKFTLRSSSPSSGSGVGKLQILKQIAPELCLGAEYCFGGAESGITFSGRMTEENDTILTGSLGTSSFGLTYYQRLQFPDDDFKKIVEQAHFGVEVKHIFSQGLIAAIATRYYDPLTRNTVKVMLDMGGTFTASFEKPLTSVPINLSSCLTVNLFRGVFRVGLGFSSSS